MYFFSKLNLQSTLLSTDTSIKSQTN